jgi:hypothetical protein
MKEEAKKSNIEWVDVNDTDIAPSVNWDDTKEVVGKIKNFKKVEFGDRIREVCVIETLDGPVSVWESVGLRSLFEKCAVGNMVKIVNEGWKKGKTGRRFRAFRIQVAKG